MIVRGKNESVCDHYPIPWRTELSRCQVKGHSPSLKLQPDFAPLAAKSIPIRQAADLMVRFGDVGGSIKLFASVCGSSQYWNRIKGKGLKNKTSADDSVYFQNRGKPNRTANQTI